MKNAQKIAAAAASLFLVGLLFLSDVTVFANRVSQRERAAATKSNAGRGEAESFEAEGFVWDDIPLATESNGDPTGQKATDSNVILSQAREGRQPESNVQYQGALSDHANYTFSFELDRDEFSDVQNQHTAYYNYGVMHPDAPFFDRAAWALKSFSVEYELHIKDSGESLLGGIFYDEDQYEWKTHMSFRDIPIDYPKVIVEYYNGDEGNYVPNALLHYDLYLDASAEKECMILRLPSIQPTWECDDPGKMLRMENPHIWSGTLYLNGEAGDDQKDGRTEENAVKSVKRIKELLGGAAAQTEGAVRRPRSSEGGNRSPILADPVSVVVTGTTDIEGDALSFPGIRAKFLRGETFNQYLFRVPQGKEATLSQVIIDGNSENNTGIETSLMEVCQDGVLNIREGTVLRNNQIKALPDDATNGGGIYAYHATVNMTGGMVEENQATRGGGIQISGSVMNFSGGVVRKNRSERVRDDSVTPAQYYAAGGGILVCNGGTLNLSGNAEVRDNYSGEVGGGISLGMRVWGPTNTLYMDGGTIDGNVAGSSGGGLFVQAKYFSGGPSRAYVFGGRITNNRMDNSGATDSAFGGGGIYVNGANNRYGIRGANGELYLKNAVITDNTARWDGGGYAACPISHTIFHLKNGVALYGNHAPSAEDFFLLCAHVYGTHGGEPKYELSERMLGGVPYHWKERDGSLFPKERYQGQLTKDLATIGLHTEERGNLLTRQLAKVLIAGNDSATRGGGIGTNGTVTIGEDEANTKISVVKKWEASADGEDAHPDSVTVELIGTAAGASDVIEQRTLSAENDWKTTFEKLPKYQGDAEITYTVREAEVKGYTGTVRGSEADGFVITNKKNTPPVPPTPLTPPKTEVKVKKEWILPGGEQPPGSVEMVLCRDGVETGEKRILNGDNHWSAVFSDLPVVEQIDSKHPYEYSVKEAGETGNRITLNGTEYGVIYAGTMEEGFTVTNKREPKSPPPTPLTPPKTEVRVKKEWILPGGEQPPGSVEMVLCRDGVETGEKRILNGDNHWSAVFSDLPVVEQIDSKHPYEYSVKEAGETGNRITLNGTEYGVIYAGTMEEGFTVTNKREPKSPPPEEPKKPRNPGGGNPPPDRPGKPKSPPPDQPGKPKSPPPVLTPSTPVKMEKPGQSMPKTGQGKAIFCVAWMLILFAALFFLREVQNERLRRRRHRKIHR